MASTKSILKPGTKPKTFVCVSVRPTFKSPDPADIAKSKKSNNLRQLIFELHHRIRPPLTFNFSDKDLQGHVLRNDLVIPDIPCHSQANERAVQDTSIVAKQFSTYEKRHANLLQTMSSREKFSKDSKVEDFKK